MLPRGGDRPRAELMLLLPTTGHGNHCAIGGIAWDTLLRRGWDRTEDSASQGGQRKSDWKIFLHDRKSFFVIFFSDDLYMVLGNSLCSALCGMLYCGNWALHSQKKWPSQYRVAQSTAAIGRGATL